ncbi:MAG TPA: dihydrofolate reductase [Devosiaceae bacterium]|jgi:hypothetical protein|nr:dihydrofolate reductase [Devosiaceae bacterium]
MPSPPPLPPTDIPAGIEVEGHAVVSSDGMIADSAGNMPSGLRNDEEWERFQQSLDRSALIALGRLAHRRHPNTGRNRLVFTGSVAGMAPDPEDPAAIFFNPAGASLGAALRCFGILSGTIAVTGGTGVFGYFLEIFNRFALGETNSTIIPGGRPCFAAGHPRTVLAAAGLLPDRIELIDVPANVTLTHWERPAPPPEDRPFYAGPPAGEIL